MGLERPRQLEDQPKLIHRVLLLAISPIMTSCNQPADANVNFLNCDAKKGRPPNFHKHTIVAYGIFVISQDREAMPTVVGTQMRRCRG
ncbi:uncharacterized protein F4822DRAFT_104120 [Hypoxylon trugodes]|uniref:uncharacterized protein n=1 Tax=Hypoxylon trugodes TaxID=326681 RepID=UPI0021A14D42|nr:uncharacterized protein F4822DRAFT_104120 [Hypoxylon trugodes]KAI1382601.1 hypothetical protein F4822DRAFT_104120 [Hypoxylon trugodes]